MYLIVAAFMGFLFMGVTSFRSIAKGLFSIRNTLQYVNQSYDFTPRANLSGNNEISQTGKAFEVNY